MGRQVGQDADRRPCGAVRCLKGVEGEERRNGGDGRDGEDGKTPQTHPAPREKPRITPGSAAGPSHSTVLVLPAP
jgi:hypothetical protein